jgi:hypothetical protein
VKWEPVAETGSSENYIEAKPDDVIRAEITFSRKKHNPDKLTDEQVGVAEGWRLLDEDEIVEVLNDENDVEGYCRFNSDILWFGGYYGSSGSITYRTRLTREELAKARGL